MVIENKAEFAGTTPRWSIRRQQRLLQGKRLYLRKLKLRGRCNIVGVLFAVIRV